jgi:hypothetical protein
MPGFGKALVSFGSGLTAGPLGVIQLGFEGYDLGKTVAAATLKPDLDVKGINYQQEGTKDADHVITGADWMLTGSFGEINTELLKIIAPYLIASSGSVGSDSGYFKADMYESLMDTASGVVKAAIVKDKVPSLEVEDTMFFYRALFLINADLINWGADVQRNLPFEIKIKAKIMTAQESSTVSFAYGYWGDPSAEDLPAAAWPDLEAPYPVSSAVTLATELTLTLNENATEISGVTSTEQVVVRVNNKYVVPTVVGYATNVITLTLPAASITSGDTVTTSINAGTFEDGDSNANEDVVSFVAVNGL